MTHAAQDLTMSDVIVCIPTAANFDIYGIPERETETLMDRTGLPGGPLSAPNGKSGTSPMVLHDENSHDIANDTGNDKGIAASLRGGGHARESRRIPASRRPLACNIEARRKIVGELLGRNPLIICHDLVDIRINLRM